MKVGFVAVAVVLALLGFAVAGAVAHTQLLHETLDLLLTREAAETELREILLDEPDWKDVLRVIPVELDERDVSAN
jgi:hypothetical protein